MQQSKTRIALITVIAAVAVVLGLASQKPDVFHVERSTVIATTPGKIFPYLNDLQKWNTWSPWAKLDPSGVMTLEGPKTGVGASLSWSGNMKVGAGKMTISESTPRKSVGYDLEFVKPMKGVAKAAITLVPQGRETTVTWTMDGEQKFLNKVVSVFMNCDKLVGKQFDDGLANLKAVAEAK